MNHDPAPGVTQAHADPQAYEQANVHNVYSQIASHFSATRYKPWPIIEAFLKELPVGAIGLDAGCGNGKYLAVRDDLFILASDRSPELCSFAAKHQPHATLTADVLDLPHPAHTFDFAISIAVIHHLSTPQRRVAAIRAVLETLKEGGEALFFVWALEQATSRRGWGENSEQDQMVPWVLKPRNSERKERGKREKNGIKEMTEDEEKREEKVFRRYYHLYKEGELEADVEKAGGLVARGGWERDNWWCVARLRPDEYNRDDDK